MTPAIIEGDGPLSRYRYYSGTRTLPEVAFASDAFRGPLAPDQLVPVAALRTA